MRYHVRSCLHFQNTVERLASFFGFLTGPTPAQFAVRMSDKELSYRTRISEYGIRPLPTRVELTRLSDLCANRVRLIFSRSASAFHFS